ncbi:MAG: acyl-CoA dehydrogenase [Oligoflexales bacterium]|nr:acyl-CoA dehydrogenase [Oligoflexales bacterium]
MGFSVDRRDQQFVLHEMLEMENLFKYPEFSEFDRSMVDMTLDCAAQIAQDAMWPTFAEGDKQGAHLENGSVKAPSCYHDLLRTMNESGLPTLAFPQKDGGQGMPHVMDAAAREHYVYNMGFNLYTEATIGAAGLIASFGTEQQKRKYMDKMVAGKWGGTMILTEPGAGSDVGALTTKAVKNADGSYSISGSKIFISGGDCDLYENIVHPVLARIEGDPPGTEGISIFLVPKYLVGSDGSLGRRNDYLVSGIEHKLGIKGSATCTMTFGDRGECYGEILGEPRQGMKVMFQMMNEARIGMGIQGVGTASAAYLHALRYAKERVQGSDLTRKDPARKVPIIRHPDVRRMLLWMKSQVEGMRALVYYASMAIDHSKCLKNDDGRKWGGVVELFVPLVKAYCTDIGFKVTECALQVFGGYGYTQDYPMEQLMRDMKIGSIYEGTNGIQSLDLVGRKLAMRGGEPFMTFLTSMKQTILKYQKDPAVSDLIGEVTSAVEQLSGIGLYFSSCTKEGKPILPIVKAYPFLTMLGNVTLGWLHLWQAAIAGRKLGEICTQRQVDPKDPVKMGKLASEDPEAAFYIGKFQGATYYIKNILPEARMLAETIKNQDLSVMMIPEESFAEA